MLALEGFQQNRNNRREDEVDQQKRTLFDQQQQDRQVALDEAIQTKERNDAFRERMRQIRANPNRTTKDFQDVMLDFPVLGKGVQPLLENESTEALKEQGTMAFGVKTALKNGKPEEAIIILERTAEAHRNSGDENKAKIFDLLIEQIENDPEGAEFAVDFGAFMALGPKDHAEFNAKLELQKQAQGVKDLTARQDDYGFYVSDQLKRGLEPLSFNDWDLQKNDNAATLVGQELSQKKFDAAELKTARAEQRLRFKDIQEEMPYKSFKALEDAYKRAIKLPEDKRGKAVLGNEGLFNVQQNISAEKVISDYEFVTGKVAEEVAETVVEQSTDIPTATSADGKKVQFINGQWVPVE